LIVDEINYFRKQNNEKELDKFVILTKAKPGLTLASGKADAKK